MARALSERPKNANVTPAGFDDPHLPQLGQLLVDGLPGGPDHVRERFLAHMNIWRLEGWRVKDPRQLAEALRERA